MVIINSCVALIMLYIIFHVFNSHFPYVPLYFNMNFTFITFDIKKKMKIVHENYCQWHEIYTCNTTYKFKYSHIMSWRKDLNFRHYTSSLMN